MPGVELKLVTLDGERRRARRGGRGPGQGAAADAGLPRLRRSTPTPSTRTATSAPATSAGSTSAGNLIITGRLKDIIIRKGENVSAKEVEDLLYTHPKVADVAVIGLPDPDTGERVCAVVQTAEGDGAHHLRRDGRAPQGARAS